ncbi:MAG: hypothetical protein FWF46_04165 [Oscillospiraceae bacterium]|nr:hypothetical protein [Oscillospiraceae bacterium]
MCHGTLTGIYALTGDGKLLSINESYDSSKDKTNYVLGLSYEDCTSIKGVTHIDSFVALQITKDDYLRDGSDIQANYILDSNNNKITVKYLFEAYSQDTYYYYIVTLDNKIYYILENDIDNDNYNSAKLLNNKTVNGISYDDNNSVITVTYTDNTIDKFNCGDATNKYGF